MLTLKMTLLLTECVPQYAAADVHHLFDMHDALNQFMLPKRLLEISEHRIRKTIARTREEVERSHTHNSAARDFKLRPNDYCVTDVDMKRST